MIDKQKLFLTLDLPASVNSIYGRNKFGGTYLKKEGKEYKEDMVMRVIDEVSRQGWVKPEDRFIYMDEVVYFNRAGRDVDNLKKLQQDAITESRVVWSDDSWTLPRTERTFIDKHNPRIELVLSIAPFIGIFNNKEALISFESKCKTCRRYSNNCSILRKAKENRIQKEIIGLSCSEYNRLKDL